MKKDRSSIDEENASRISIPDPGKVLRCRSHPPIIVESATRYDFAWWYDSWLAGTLLDAVKERATRKTEHLELYVSMYGTVNLNPPNM